MTLADSIGNSLIRIVHSLPKDWPNVFSVQPGIEDELRQAAVIEPIHSVDFLRFLLSSRHEFPEQLFIATLPVHLRPSITRLLERRSGFRNRKEELVTAGNFEQAAECRDSERNLTDEIESQLAGQHRVITIGCVWDAMERLGWPGRNGCSGSTTE